MNANTEKIARGAGWCALTLGLLIAGWLLLTDSGTSPASLDVSNGVQHASHSKRAKALTSTRNIQDIRVGDRVIAHNPNVSEEERQAFAEPDWSRWLKLSGAAEEGWADLPHRNASLRTMVVGALQFSDGTCRGSGRTGNN